MIINLCKFNDCGWCYAPVTLITNNVQGACVNPSKCSSKLKGGVDNGSSKN